MNDMEIFKRIKFMCVGYVGLFSKQNSWDFVVPIYILHATIPFKSFVWFSKWHFLSCFVLFCFIFLWWNTKQERKYSSFSRFRCGKILIKS